MSAHLIDGPVVLSGVTDGVAIVPSPNPLSRLNFFDGRLLTGADLTVEQDAERGLDRLVAGSSSSGVAWGLDVGRAGEILSVSAGLAFDPGGRPLLLPSPVQLSVADLLGADAVAPPSRELTGTPVFAPCVLGLPVEVTVDPVAAWSAYLLTIGWVEGWCGTMDVYGAACEQACVGTTNRPYRVDGVVFRLRPLSLQAPLPASKAVLLTATHLRSRLAAAYFADERAAGPALSAATLSAAGWCTGGTEPGGAEVPLAMVVRFGRSTGFHDEWAARRERLEPPPRIGFDLRMAMRPRAVWDAQMGQFQCQLADRIGTGGLPSGSRRLIDGGVVELPPCGYLPIDQHADVIAQVTAMMGAGVDLRFVPVPVDAIAHELEIVQHRDRISLLTGLDDPAHRPPVDILVPGGSFGSSTATDQLFRALVSLDSGGGRDEVLFRGVGRLVPRGSGFALSAAGMAGVTTIAGAKGFVTSVGEAALHPGTAIRRATGSAAELSLDALRQAAEQTRTFVNRIRDGRRAARPSIRLDRADAKPIAGRAVIEIDRDPWDLGLPDVAFGHLAVDLLTTVENPESVSLEIIGQLTLLEAANPASRRFRFSGQLAVTGTDGAVDQRAVDVSATVERTPGGADQPDQYRVTGIESVLQVLNIGGTPLGISGWAQDRLDQARLVADPSVADPTSAYRRLAEMALHLLPAARPTDEQFLERATIGTLGPTGTAQTMLTAATDWVAFRRRPPAMPATVAPPSTVNVWVSRNRAAKASGMVSWQRVGVASFDPASGALLTPAAALRAGYTATGAGAVIEVAAYAPAAMPSGPARTASVVAALAPVAALSPGGTITSWDSPPAGYVDPATDGSVFLFAQVAEPVDNLLQVVGVDLSDPNQRLLAELLGPPLRGPLADPALTDLGSIPFPNSAPDQASTDAVTQALIQLLGALRNVKGLPVLWVDGDWANANPDLAETVINTGRQIAVKLATAQGLPIQVPIEAAPIGTDPTPVVLIEAGSKS